MIKTIKVKKQLRLDELIKHIFDNDIRGGRFFCCTEDTHIKVFDDGRVYSSYAFSKSDTFTVEVEEEITQEILLQNVVIIVLNGIKHMPSTVYHSIRSIRRDYPTVTEIHTLMNGKLQLIWEVE